MKSLVTLVVGSALVGLGLGAALAYMEVGPATLSPAPTPEPVNEATIPKLASPRAEVPESTFEFDRIERGTSMRHTFAIRNIGGAPLKIDFVSNTCKCTAVELAGRQIEPGASATVASGEAAEVTLEWAAKTAAGPFRHGATFSTNDPQQSRIELMVDGEVVESTSMSPSELLFGSIRAGSEQVADVYLMSFVDRAVEILSFEVTDDKLAEQLEVKIREADPNELPSPEAVRGLKVSALYRTGKTIGPFGGWLTLTTNLPNAEKLMIPIAGRVVGDISIFGPGWIPARGLLRLGPVQSATGKTVRLNVAIRGEFAKETELQVGSVDPPELHVELGESRQMSDTLVHMPMQVEVRVGTRPLVRMGEPSSTDATIILESNHPETPEVKLRVRFAVTK